MPNFLSKILKQKKLLTFALLFIVLAGVLTPQIANAQLAGIVSTLLFSAKDILPSLLNSFFNAILVFSVIGPLVIAVALSTIAKVLLSIAILYATTIASYTHSEAVNLGWTIVRDLANMMIILGFVVVGIAFALRMESYGSKKVLFNLIIAAILINFSLVICGVFIDGTNILMVFFFGNTGELSTWIPAIQDFLKLFSGISSDNIMEFAPKLFALVFFNFIAFFVYLAYAFLILGRVVALWALVILSPLAFVCYVFPATKTVWNMWWSNFFQWCIVIIPAGLFYYIGSTMISSGDAMEFVSDGEMTEYMKNGVDTILLPGLLLILGFLVSLKMAPAGASAILGFANKQKGKILGGALGIAGKVHNNTTGLAFGFAGDKFGQWGARLQAKAGVGNTIGGGALKALSYGAKGLANPVAQSQKTMHALGKAGAFVGAISKEEAKEKDYSIVSGHSKRLDQVEDNRELAKISEKETHEGAAAAEILAKRKALDFIPKDKREAIAANATKFGVRADAFKDKPDLLTGVDDKLAINALITKKATEKEKTGMKAELAMAEAKAERSKITQTEIDEQKKTMNQEVIKQRSLGYVPVDNQDATSRAKEEHVKDLITKINPATGSLHTEEEARKIAEKFVPSASQILAAGQKVTQERIAKAVRKLSPAKAAELPTEAIAPEVVSNFDARQIEEIGKKGGGDLISELAKYKPVYTKSGRLARRSRQTKEAQSIKDYYDTLPAGREKTKLEDAMAQLGSDKNIV